MISDLEEFIKYFHGQRRRTQWTVDAVPADKGLWRPWPGEPTPAEIICEMAAGHLMYATVVAHDYWAVDNYEAATLDWDSARTYFEAKTEAALDLLRPLNNNVLKAKRRKLDSTVPMSAWRFLAAMLDHEISSRAALNSYLMLLNVHRPTLDATTLQAVRAALK